MPLFDFEAFSIFAENYCISGENIAVACDINGEVRVVDGVVIAKANDYLAGMEDGKISNSSNLENHWHVL
jgi:hypothetical protein